MAPKVNLLTIIRNIFAAKSGANNKTSSATNEPLLSFEPKRTGTNFGYETTKITTFIPKDIVSNFAYVIPEFPTAKGVENLDLTSPEIIHNQTYQKDIAYHEALKVPTEPEYAEV